MGQRRESLGRGGGGVGEARGLGVEGEGIVNVQGSGGVRDEGGGGHASSARGGGEAMNGGLIVAAEILARGSEGTFAFRVLEEADLQNHFVMVIEPEPAENLPFWRIVIGTGVLEGEADLGNFGRGDFHPVRVFRGGDEQARAVEGREGKRGIGMTFLASGEDEGNRDGAKQKNSRPAGHGSVRWRRGGRGWIPRRGV